MTAKTPIRTCVACRCSDDKSTLIRFVRLADNSVEVDRSGKMPGRGAYLCCNEACFNNVAHNRRLDRALRASISEERWSRLADAFFEFCSEFNQQTNSDRQTRKVPKIGSHDTFMREQD